MADTDPFAPAFLICSERSGSNLLRAMMDAHHGVYAPISWHLGHFFWDSIALYGDLGVDKAWRALIRHLVAFSTTGTIRFAQLDLTEEELLAEAPERDFASLYAYVYRKGMSRARKSIAFIKENRWKEKLHYLASRFPGARFVIQVRDPRDVIASCKQIGYLGSLFDAVDIWKEEQRFALSVRYTLGPSRVILQRYEDLVNRPERVLARLCRFIGLSYDARMLRFHETDSAKTAASVNSFWANIAKPLRAPEPERYKQRLNRVEIAVIEHSLADLMRRFGYAPSTASPPAWAKLLVRAADPRHVPLLRRLLVAATAYPPHPDQNDASVERLYDRTIEPDRNHLFEDSVDQGMSGE